jgi:hypothetical protein
MVYSACVARSPDRLPGREVDLMNPAGNAPEHRQRFHKFRHLLARTLNSEEAFKVLVAAGEVAALVHTIYGCN